ncbi:hypothetical protein IKF15_03885 [Candidatus Saccharibacteria bacterium]|nr:hypothetical protein [Candidatus Saccharibacteria bacterium]
MKKKLLTKCVGVIILATIGVSSANLAACSPSASAISDDNDVLLMESRSEEALNTTREATTTATTVATTTTTTTTITPTATDLATTNTMTTSASEIASSYSDEYAPLVYTYQFGDSSLTCSINIDDYIDDDGNVDLYGMATDAGFDVKDGSWYEDVRDSSSFERRIDDTLVWLSIEEDIRGETSPVGRTPLASVSVLFMDSDTYQPKSYSGSYFKHYAPDESKYKLFNKAWSVSYVELIAFAVLLENIPKSVNSDPFGNILPEYMVVSNTGNEVRYVY